MNLRKLKFFVYPLDNGIINFNIISTCIDQFYADILSPLPSSQFIFFQIKVKLSNNMYRTIGYGKIINKNDLDFIKKYISMIYTGSFENYEDFLEDSSCIYIQYKLLDMNKEDYNNLLLDRNKSKNININTQRFNNIYIPLEYNTEKWGFIKDKNHLDDLITYEIIRKDYFFVINQNNNQRIVKIYKDNDLLFKFIDVFKDDYFIRNINKNSYHIKDNNIILTIENKSNNDFIKKFKKDKTIQDDIITLDLETISKIINNEEVLQVISCCIYDGVNKSMYYLDDYNSSDDLLKSAIKSLLINRYNDYRIYIHNLSNFDGIFLLKILAQIPNTNIKIIKKDDKMIAITLSFGDNKIIFHDSMLLLPSSLEKLSKAFNVNNKKVIFPIKWLLNNPNFNISYIGNVPDIKYFKDITITDYIEYITIRNNIWNFRNELLNYNMIDCISLYEILIEFNHLIYEKFSLNITRFPTLPSLAFGIYKAHFLNDYKIPKIGGKIYNDIRKSYTGGAIDMYIPYGKNLYHYDINSLYPNSMFRCDMPIGNIKYFIGNILNSVKNPFGFFKCNVISPEYLDNPILQIKHDNRTISPLGSFTSWFFSEELFNAKKYGYKFEILEGYLFEKDNIFKDYISVLHEMKQSSEKSTPIYLISKLLMNSLYGKFGMSDDLPIHEIVNSENLDKILKSKDKINTDELDDDLFLVSYHEICKENPNDETEYDISVGIASAITAYSRMLMTQFKNLSNNKIYYTDTDSAIMEHPLYKSVVGNHLGGMVLEKEYKEFVSLGPKVYGGVLKDGKEFTKVKGFKNHVTFDDLKSLLNKDKSLKLKHSKWFKFINKGYISIKDETYTLSPSQNKRKLIYENNKLIDTSSIIMTGNQISDINNIIKKDD